MIRFGLKNTVGPGDPVGREDALAMKRALAELGDYEAGPDGVSPWPDGAMIDALRRFQGRNGLYSDGTARPGGPTETMLKSALARRAVKQKQGARGAGRPPAALDLRGSVGWERDNRAEDVVGLKNMLAWTGHYPADKARAADPAFDDDLMIGIGGFQRDFELKRDGVAGPDGETQERLNAVVGPLIEAEWMARLDALDGPARVMRAFGTGPADRGRDAEKAGPPRGQASRDGEPGGREPARGASAAEQQAIRDELAALARKAGVSEFAQRHMDEAQRRRVESTMIVTSRTPEEHLETAREAGRRADALLERGAHAEAYAQRREQLEALEMHDRAVELREQGIAREDAIMPDPAAPRVEEADPMSRWNPDLADSWVGSAGDMADAVGIDPELVENAPSDIAETLAGAIAYDNLGKDAQQQLDDQVRRLEDAGHGELAAALKALPERLKREEWLGQAVHLPSEEIRDRIARLEREIQGDMVTSVGTEILDRFGRRGRTNRTGEPDRHGKSSGALEPDLVRKQNAVERMKRELERRKSNEESD